VGAPAEQAAPAPTMRVAAEEDDLSTPDGLQGAIDRSVGRLREAAGLLRKKDPKDPLAYRFARIAAWAQLAEIPGDEDGKTRIPPLGASADLSTRYSEMASGRDWANLLEQAEYQFEQSVFWLDCQRFVAMALDGLGSGYESALEVVRAENASLLRRFPGLVELHFDNNFPFASPETRTWIQQEILPATQSGGASQARPVFVAAAASAPDEKIAGVISQARDLWRKKRSAEALALFTQAVESASSRRQRFERRFAMARFLADSKEHRVAIAHLEILDDEVRQHRLEEWDPPLALDVLRIYLGCQRAMAKGIWNASPDAERKAEEIYLRIARLDASAVLGM